MRFTSESHFQSWFTKWLKRGGGASRSSSACVHKISDSGVGVKPFDCFVFGVEEDSFLGRFEVEAVAFELKLSKTETIPFSELLTGTRAGQLTALLKCKRGGFYAFAFKDSESVYLVHASDVEQELIHRGLLTGTVRGGLTRAWAMSVGFKVE